MVHIIGELSLRPPYRPTVGADLVKIRQAVGKLRWRQGLVMSGEPQASGYRVKDWARVAKKAE
jgi:hypothetical protein